MSAAAGPSPSVSAPLVSVIVPAFNAGATLGETLSSAIASTFRDIEIIVVDDGSTDATAAVAEEFARRDDRIRLHRRKQGGVSAAFNAGLDLARGDYVARLDSDDIWHPLKLQKQVDFARAAPDAAFIYTFVRYIDAEGLVIRDPPPQHFPRWALCRSLFESLAGVNSSALMRRSVVAGLGGYDETLASWEDLLLQLQICARHPIGHVPEYLVGYRVRPGSLSADPHNMLSSWRVARQKVELCFPQIPPRVLDWADGRRCAAFAESFAWQGRYGACAALLGEAMRHDPLWTAQFLQYRLRRHLKRRFSAPAPAAPAPAFRDCRPDEQVVPTESDEAIRPLEEKRITALAALDSQIAGSAPESDGNG